MPNPVVRYQISISLTRHDFDRLKKFDGKIKIVEIFRRGLEVSEIQAEHERNKK